MTNVKLPRAYILSFPGVFYNASVLFTLAITFDRYLKVEYGLQYHNVFTKKRLVILIVAAWTIAFLTPLTSLLTPDAR